MLFIILFLCNLLNAQYFPVIKNDKIGYINNKGELKLEAIYETEYEYYLFKRDNRYELGIRFPDNIYFNNGLAVAQKYKWFWILFPYKTLNGVIDTNGNSVFFKNIERTHTIENGILKYDYYDINIPSIEKFNYNFINLEKIKEKYRFNDYIEDFEEVNFKNEFENNKLYYYLGFLKNNRRLAYEYLNNNNYDIYFLNEKDEKVIEIKNTVYASDFNESISLIKTNDDVFFIDTNGNKLFLHLEKFSDATEFSCERAFIFKEGKFYLIDNKGNYVTKDSYDFVTKFVNNYAKVTKDGKNLLIDKSGKVIIDKFQNFSEVYENTIPVFTGSHWQLYNLSTNKLDENKFELIMPFKNGLAMAWTDKQILYINVEGQKIYKVLSDREYERILYDMIGDLNTR